MWAQCIKLFSVFQNIYVDSLGLKYKFRCELHQRRSFFSEGDLLWRMRGVKKPYFSIYERKKIPHIPEKQNRGRFIWKFQSLSEVWQPLHVVASQPPKVVQTGMSVQGGS